MGKNHIYLILLVPLYLFFKTRILYFALSVIWITVNTNITNVEGGGGQGGGSPGGVWEAGEERVGSGSSKRTGSERKM